jgi:hypothetical protein
MTSELGESLDAWFLGVFVLLCAGVFIVFLLEPTIVAAMIAFIFLFSVGAYLIGRTLMDLGVWQ